MKILVACEESQKVCKAFRARGHEAYSCDIQKCSGGHPEWLNNGVNRMNDLISRQAAIDAIQGRKRG